MTTAAPKNNSFAKAFLPGLVVGLLVGMAIGAIVPPFFDGPKLPPPDPSKPVHATRERDERPPEATPPAIPNDTKPADPAKPADEPKPAATPPAKP